MTNINTSNPINQSPLSGNGYKFVIEKIPNLSYFCQEVNLPSITLGEISMPTPLTAIALPGDQVTYDPLTVDFLLDNTMSNYVAIHEWIIGLGFPLDNADYAARLAANTQTGLSDSAKAYSDATLQILDSFNNPIRTIQFVDIVPQTLEALTFTSTSQDVTYLIGRVSFRYTYYKFI